MPHVTSMHFGLSSQYISKRTNNDVHPNVHTEVMRAFAPILLNFPIRTRPHQLVKVKVTIQFSQSALLFIPTPTRLLCSGKHSSHATHTREDNSLTFPPPSIGRYSLIPLSELGCRGEKENVLYYVSLACPFIWDSRYDKYLYHYFIIFVHICVVCLLDILTVCNGQCTGPNMYYCKPIDKTTYMCVCDPGYRYDNNAEECKSKQLSCHCHISY